MSGRARGGKASPIARHPASLPWGAISAPFARLSSVSRPPSLMFIEACGWGFAQHYYAHAQAWKLGMHCVSSQDHEMDETGAPGLGASSRPRGSSVVIQVGPARPCRNRHRPSASVARKSVAGVTSVGSAQPFSYCASAIHLPFPTGLGLWQGGRGGRGFAAWHSAAWSV